MFTRWNSIFYRIKQWFFLFNLTAISMLTLCRITNKIPDGSLKFMSRDSDARICHTVSTLSKRCLTYRMLLPTPTQKHQSVSPYSQRRKTPPTLRRTQWKHQNTHRLLSPCLKTNRYVNCIISFPVDDNECRILVCKHLDSEWDALGISTVVIHIFVPTTSRPGHSTKNG